MWERDELLAAFRERRGPTAHAVERIHQRLEALGPAPQPAKVIELAPVRRTDRRTRIAIAVGALAAAAVLGWWIRGVTMTPAPQQHGSLAEDAAQQEGDGGVAQARKTEGVAHERGPAAIEAAPAEVVTPPEPTPPVAVELAPTPPTAVRARSPRRRPPETPEPAAAEPPPASPDTLAAETAIVRRARAELSRDRAQRALAILDEHAQQFPRGALLEEAHAVRTMAQCRLHTGDASHLGAAFVQRFPRSLFRSQVDAACKEATE